MWQLLSGNIIRGKNSVSSLRVAALLSRSLSALRGKKMLDLLPLVICGPSGCGKSTLVKRLMKECPGKFGFSVSHTTRKPRPGEEEGREYFFTDRNTMLKAIEDGEFLESAEYGSNMYGTSKKAVQNVIDAGQVCILDIDTQGVKNVKELGMKCYFLFIKPPSMDILEERLRGRGTETEEALQKRLVLARREMEYGEIPENFNSTIVNDDLEKAYLEFKSVVDENIISLT